MEYQTVRLWLDKGVPIKPALEDIYHLELGEVAVSEEIMEGERRTVVEVSTSAHVGFDTRGGVVLTLPPFGSLVLFPPLAVLAMHVSWNRGSGRTFRNPYACEHCAENSGVMTGVDFHKLSVNGKMPFHAFITCRYCLLEWSAPLL
ncbi:MAG: hypothetical protein HY459_00270 [Parcubacteria group bacterium]|nr:hypothetical protein [Parcubacteria group bacterium]